MRRALIRKYKRFKKWAIPELKRRFSSTQEIPYKDTPIVMPLSSIYAKQEYWTSFHMGNWNL